MAVPNFLLWTYIRSLTALHASSEEVAEWINKDNTGRTDGSRQSSDGENHVLQSQQATSSSGGTSEPSLQSGKPTSSGVGKSKYPFICECFFMTARVLNLGLLKAFSDFKHLVQVLLTFYVWLILIRQLLLYDFFFFCPFSFLIFNEYALQ